VPRGEAGARVEVVGLRGVDGFLVEAVRLPVDAGGFLVEAPDLRAVAAPCVAAAGPPAAESVGTPVRLDAVVR
jgi:hypothetical protein